MTVAECYQYVQQRLNKIASNSGDNLPKWAFVSAFNAQQMLWAEDRMKISETNTIRKDEIARLLKQTPKPLPATQSGFNHYEVDLPEDYYHYNRSTSIVQENNCEIRNILVKEGNINTLLLDDNWKPSVEWGETICTLKTDRLRVYVDNFDISGVNLLYYRLPNNINMATGHNDVNGNPTIDIDPEFYGSSIVEILNMTVELLSSDNNDQFVYQTTAQRNIRHT